MACCCKQFLNFLFLLFNTVFWIMGFIILGLGWAWETQLHITPESKVVAYMLIVCGLCIVVTGFIGWYSVVINSTCLLGLYTVLASTIFVLEISIGVYVRVKKGHLADSLEAAINRLY